MNKNINMFAPDLRREINDAGKSIIIFPDDTALRKGLFPNWIEHPAKNNLFIYQYLAEYLMEPGQNVLDPMGGAGSVMALARLGFKTFLIEINPKFYDIDLLNAAHMSNDLREGHITTLFGDCAEILPLPGMNHIIFSPPYSNQLHDDKSGTMDTYDSKVGTAIRDFIDNNPGNLGNMRDFFFDHAMRNIYKKCFDSLVPGGTMSFILKDHIKAAKRIRVTEHHVRLASRAGFVLHDWFQRESIGGIFGRINKSKGQEIVEEEDIVIMVKE
jgi:DNA modification methylase